jgi:UDP-N-acetylmuramoylalanine--D-glutamate ligase
MMDVRGKRCVVVGAGASGLSAAELLKARGASVVVNDARGRDAIGVEALESEAHGVELALGGHERAFFDDADLVVVSPGVPPLLVLDAIEADGVEVIGEIELAWRFLSGTLIGITGTNGKSTVTTLVGEMLKRSGLSTFVGGNLGVALTEAVGSDADAPDGRLVVELSSFQLERVRDLAPHVGVLLNVTPDHLDRYPSFEAYGEAKGNLFRHQSADDHAIYPDGDPLCRRLASRGRAMRHAFAGEAGEVRVVDGAIVDAATGWTFPVSDMALSGLHNQSNACAAVLAARIAGASADAMASALREVRGLAHRAELVRELHGVRYIDDSKATNVGATVAALDGLASAAHRAVLIAGGVDKGGSYAPLAERMVAVGRAVVLIGQAADLIRDAIGDAVPVERASSMDEAVGIARGLARSGDLVLLAPACSSFDMYRSYAHRGDAFQDAVRALPGGDR